MAWLPLVSARGAPPVGRNLEAAGCARPCWRRRRSSGRPCDQAASVISWPKSLRQIAGGAAGRRHHEQVGVVVGLEALVRPATEQHLRAVGRQLAPLSATVFFVSADGVGAVGVHHPHLAAIGVAEARDWAPGGGRCGGRRSTARSRRTEKSPVVTRDSARVAHVDLATGGAAGSSRRRRRRRPWPSRAPPARRSWRRRRGSRSCAPSGDQAGLRRRRWRALVSARASPPVDRQQVDLRTSAPSRLPTKAIRLPSGDQRGSRVALGAGRELHGRRCRRASPATGG